MNKQLQLVLIFLVVLLSFRFFDAEFINQSIVNYLQYIAILIAVIMSFPYVLPKSKGFVFPIQLILFSILFSVLMGYQYWGQGIKHGLYATAPYLIFVFFFYLLRIKFSLALLEKLIITFGILYLVLYFYQLSQSPTILFGKSLWGDEFTEDRGITRIIFPGGGIFILSIFMAINKLTSQKKHLWLWGTMVFFGILVPILQVTRQFIAGIFLLYLFHALRTLSLTKKIMIFSVLTILVISLPFIDLPIIQGLVEATNEDTSIGTEYIRILAGEYFLFDFAPNTITKIFGNGVPYSGESSYGIFVDTLGMDLNYYISDVGIIAVFAMFGIPALIGYALIWIKSFTIPLPQEFQYLKYYLWFLLLTSLTWYTPYHYHYLISTVFVLYMYQVVAINESFRGKSKGVIR